MFVRDQITDRGKKSDGSRLLDLRCRLGSSNRPAKLARIHPGAASRPRLKIHDVLSDFDQHERSIGIVAKVGHYSSPKAVRSQLAGRSFDEVINSLFRLDPLVVMIVARKHNIYTILDEKRLNQRPQLDGRAMSPARRI